jgi:serine phosphatase RsbU (regulator of sigma subunit)
MLAAITTTLVKSYARLGYIPARILAETNNELSRNNFSEFDAELFLAAIDLKNGKMEYASAGEIAPLRKVPGSSFEKLPCKEGIKMGLLENVPYSQNEISLSQGEMLFMYTKGLPEATDDKGYNYSENYVIERISSIIQEEVWLEKIVLALGEDVSQFRGSAEQTLESTMLIFRYYG